MTEEQRYQQALAALQKDGYLAWAGLLLKRAAHNWPNNSALYYQDQSITYAELFKRSSVLAAHLLNKGITSGNTVILYYPNSIDFYIAYFAIWHIGAIVAPLNVFLTEQEVVHIIQDAQPTAIIISHNFLKNIQEIQHRIPHIITNVDQIVSTLNKDKDQHQLLEQINLAEKSIDDTAAILYTSGTTGFPKGVMLSSKNILYNILAATARFQFEPHDRALCPLPLFHSYPQSVCLWTITLIGCSAIIVPKVTRSNLQQALTYKPTVIVAVPALYNLFCLLKNLDFSSVKFFFSGGDALPDKTRNYFELLYRRKICNGYGLTETAPFISVSIYDYAAKTNNIGKPFTNISCEIRNEEQEKIAPSKTGVLWVKGPNVMKGYHNAPQATEAVLKNGWFNTGDLAYFNTIGDIIIAGRQKDLIIHKGINIYPQEIENVLLRHKQVLQAGVIGVSHEDGEIPVAFVASKTQNPEQLIVQLQAYADRQLSAYKIPRIFIIKKELPLTSTGKVDKKILRNIYQKEHAT